MPRLEIKTLRCHVGCGVDDDFTGFPGFELRIGGEHEGDGSAEHRTGEGVPAAGGGGVASEGRQKRNPEVEGADFRLVDPSLAVMLGLPFDRTLAGKGGPAEVALDAGSGKDGVGNVLGGAHLDGDGLVPGKVPGAGDEMNSAEGSVFHQLSPVRAVVAQAGTGEAHAVGVGALLDGPLHGLLDMGHGDHAGPAGLRGESRLNRGAL